MGVVDEGTAAVCTEGVRACHCGEEPQVAPGDVVDGANAWPKPAGFRPPGRYCFPLYRCRRTGSLLVPCHTDPVEFRLLELFARAELRARVACPTAYVKSAVQKYYSRLLKVGCCPKISQIR